MLPVIHYSPFTATDAAGRQTLVTVFTTKDDAGENKLRVTVAYRAGRWDTWGAPVELTEAP
jgi:hypothetical protein